MQYDPTSTTVAYFDVIGGIFKGLLMYRGTSNPRSTSYPLNSLSCYNDSTAYYQNQHRLTDSEIVPCIKLSAINRALTSTEWELYFLNGERFYKSESYPFNSKCIIEFPDLNIAVGTRFRLKAAAKVKDDWADVILEYRGPDPTLTTAMFFLKGTAFKTNLNYEGTLHY